MIDSSKPNHRPRLLMVNYACSPYHGSEGGSGWRRALAEVEHFDIWVICERRHYSEHIERYLRENGPIEGLKFVYVDIPNWVDRLPTYPPFRYFGYAAYRTWHRRALRVARELHEQFHFDVARQSTMGGYREPGYAWRLGIPFVWGPVAGTQNFPWRFLFLLGAKTAALEGFRNVINWFQLRFSRRVRRAARAASAILTASSTGARDFQRVLGVAPEVVSDIGVAPFTLPNIESRAPGPLRLLWSGVIEDRKALPVLFHALAKLDPSVAVEVRILGNGPSEKAWRRLATRLGLDDRVTWLGRLPHAEAVAQFQWADALAFTSLRDTTGTVVLEAFAAGRPVITFDHQGAADMVNESCGIKVAVTTPKKSIQDWATAIHRLATDEPLRQRLAQGALQRAGDYLWSVNGQRTADIIWRVLDARRRSSDADYQRLSSSIGDMTPPNRASVNTPPLVPAAPVEPTCR